MAAGAAVVLPDTEAGGSGHRECLAELEPDFMLLPSGSLERIGRRGPPAPEGPGVWLFTSGTTARPRPHFRSEAALVTQITRITGRLPASLVQARPAALSITPLCHGYGLLNALLVIHAIGGSVVLAQDASTPQVVRVIHDQNISMLYAWPAHFDRLGGSRQWPATADNRLRWCVSSSLRLPPAVARRFQDRSGCPVRQQYGVTECGPLCVDSGDPPVGDRCVGLPFQGVEIAIMDEAARPRPTGRRGRVAVRMTGVADPPPIRNQWYFPGDAGVLDEAGRLHVLYRIAPFHDERAEATRTQRKDGSESSPGQGG